MKEEKRKELDTIIHKHYQNIAGMVILKDGKTEYENHFNNCDAASKLHIYSVTKSIISILIGIAIDKGYIKSINEKVLSFFPDYQVKKGETTIQQITLQHLMTMTAPYQYRIAPYTKYFTSEDWVTFSLNLLGGKGKIGKFQYTPLIGPDILSGILQKTTGQTVFAFARENLFLPLGIQVDKNIIFETKEEQMAFNKATNMSGWVADPTGINTAGWGLTLSPMDMAKIGQLYLDHGLFDGTQIVSSHWIDESTTEHSRWGKLPYGYLWWIIKDNNFSAFCALGDGGNVICCIPEKNIVIAIASLFVLKAKDRIKLIKDIIYPLLNQE